MNAIRRTWWERVARPEAIKIALLGVSLLAMVLGGTASEYWE